MPRDPSISPNSPSSSSPLEGKPNTRDQLRRREFLRKAISGAVLGGLAAPVIGSSLLLGKASGSYVGAFGETQSTTITTTTTKPIVKKTSWKTTVTTPGDDGKPVDTTVTTSHTTVSGTAEPGPKNGSGTVEQTVRKTWTKSGRTYTRSATSSYTTTASHTQDDSGRTTVRTNETFSVTPTWSKTHTTTTPCDGDEIPVDKEAKGVKKDGRLAMQQPPATIDLDRDLGDTETRIETIERCSVGV